MDLWKRLRLMVRAARVVFVSDLLPTQVLQVQLNGQLTSDQVPRLAEYGFTSNPPPGTDAVVLFLAGDASAPVVVATSHQLFRPTNLPVGAAALYDATGQVLALLPTGLVVTAPLGAEFSGPVVATEIADSVGTLAELRAEVEALKTAYNSHTHSTLVPFSGSTPPTGPLDGTTSEPVA